MYLATVIDCYTKGCVGYAMADHLRADVVIDALAMAARNYPLAQGAIFHSDRGTQYTSAAFAAVTDFHDIRRSVGATGVCFDNALAESFSVAAGALSGAWGAAGECALGAPGVGVHAVVRGAGAQLRRGDADGEGRADDPGA